MIAQGMGGDIVYIASKNAVFAGPEQRRLRRGQGRPGAPGPAARRRARRARHPGQRRQPRRRRPRLGHLRRRLGRPARRRLRRARGGARRVLRPAHPAQAGGAARARRQRGVRAHRRATCRTPPACTSRSTPASPRRSCDERPTRSTRRRGRPRRVQRPGHGRPRRRRTGSSSTEVAPVRQRAGAGRPARCTGTSWALPRHPRRAARRPAPVDSRRHRLLGASTTGCSTRTARCSATRCTTATPAPTACMDAGRRGSSARSAVRDAPGSSTCRSTRLPARRGGRHAAARGGPARCC